MIKRNPKLVSDADLKTLLEMFWQGTAVTDAGLSYVSPRDFISEQLYDILPDAFTTTPELARSEAISLFRGALNEARANDEQTVEAIMRLAKDRLKKRRSVPQKQYTLWTKLRAKEADQAEALELSWDGVEVRSSTQLPSELRLKPFFLDGFGHVDPDDPQEGVFLVVTCRERDDHAAATKMFDCLQLIMGLINLYEGIGLSKGYTGKPRAEGALWFSRYQFLFRDGESIAEANLWFEVDFDDEGWRSSMPKMKNIVIHAGMAKAGLTALEKHPLRDSLVKTLLLLQDGFATRDENHRLLRYWSALEQLYGEANQQERSSGKIIKRASFDAVNRPIAQWTLQHIARLRNEFVHAGGKEGLESLGRYLCTLVSNHLDWWIFEGVVFQNHAELLEYVDLSNQPEKLNRLKVLVERRLERLEATSGRAPTQVD